MNILVTGGGRGIGRAVALAFAEPGSIVAIAARTRTELDATAQAISARGARPIALAVDVTDEEAVARAFAEVRAIAPVVDVVVNNAGVGGGQPIDQTDTASWRRIMDTNVLGLFLACRAFIPHFRARHAAGLGSQVVVVTSDVSMRTFAGGGLYTASKHAQRALVRTLAAEGQGYGLRVSEVRPGMTDTHFNGRTPGSPERALHLRSEDVAEAVAQALAAPPHVRIDEIVLHPAVQDVVF